MTVAEFIEARLADAEARANAMEHFTVDDDTYLSCLATRTEPLGDLPYGEDACDCGLAERKNRALRDVAAKREILAECKLLAMVGLAFEGEAGPEAAERIMKLLAAIDSDHPGYNPQWNP